VSRIVFCICILFGLSAGGCTIDSLTSDEPSNEFPPNYRAIIQKALENPARPDEPKQMGSTAEPRFFPIERRIANVELADSEKRLLTINHGWAWQTCMRAKLDGSQGTLAIFVANGKIVDARSALLVDDCDKKTYVALPINRPDPPGKSKKSKESR
jgi:hypothetical protein